MQKTIGIIVEYNSERKFGFIQTDDCTQNYFFHISNFLKPFDIVPNETKVLFEPSENSKGLIALNIEKFKKIVKSVEGKFSNVEDRFPDIKIYKTNKERLDFLNEQYKKIEVFLKELNKIGIKSTLENNWITVEISDEIFNLPQPRRGGHKRFVPNGYEDTLIYLLSKFEEQIHQFNLDFALTKKGISGEKKALQSLKSVAIKYPVLNNIRLEEMIGENNYNNTEKEKYVAETDIIVITDYAIFLIETKNYGKQGETIHITSNGKCTITGKYNKSRQLPNFIKQVTDHLYVIKEFMKNNSIDNLPLIPIIAIANEDVDIVSESDNKFFCEIMYADIVGSYIIKYSTEHQPIIDDKKISEIRQTLKEKKLPEKEYLVEDYCSNIKIIANEIAMLLDYWKSDMITTEKYDKEQLKRKKVAQSKKNSSYDTISKNNSKLPKKKFTMETAVELGSAIYDLIRFLAGN